jgi:hypothetical protein
MRNRRSLVVLVAFMICFCSSLTLSAQKFKPTSSVGFSIGASSFLGDLGGRPTIGRGFVYDLNIQTVRPAFSAMYRYNLNPFLAFRGELAFTQLTGDDALINADFFVDRAYTRRYRNLNFTSPLLSIGAMAEIHLYNYQPGNKDGFKVAPYIGIGGGMFWFDPRTEDPLTGGTVRLQPLGTEGQGLSGYGSKYSLIQPQLLGAVGLKYNIGPQLAMSIEVIYHHTFTDYIDDVSTRFVDPAIFFANYDPATAAQIVRLSNRSGELNLPPDPRLQAITRDGEVRGFDTNDDQFFRVQATFLYVLNAKNKSNIYRCPVW